MNKTEIFPHIERGIVLRFNVDDLIDLNKKIYPKFEACLLTFGDLLVGNPSVAAVIPFQQFEGPCFIGDGLKYLKCSISKNVNIFLSELRPPRCFISGMSCSLTYLDAYFTINN